MISAKYQARNGSANLPGTSKHVINFMNRSVYRTQHKLMDKVQLRSELNMFTTLMFYDSRTPIPLIQSYFVILWANADIHFAMNYILSVFCRKIDEVAVVTLLKQLTVFSREDGRYVNIIKAL